MENRVVVKTILSVLDEVGDGFWRFFGIQFEGDDTVVGGEFDHVGVPVI
jgi:hypothetical protein